MIKHVASIFLLAATAFAFALAPARAQSPIPVQFAPGSFGAIANGQVTMKAPMQTYSLDVSAGQMMIFTFAGGGPMRASVQCQGGVGGGPYYGTGDSITITTSGACTVTVGANTMAAPWTGGFTVAFWFSSQVLKDTRQRYPVPRTCFASATALVRG